MTLQKSVFVQIPSYRDKQLIPTLLDLIGNSSNPEVLRIAVCWQHGED
ncbi:GlcNAc-transferase family protein, partial [Lysobacter sp. 2RAB21]